MECLRLTASAESSWSSSIEWIRKWRFKSNIWFKIEEHKVILKTHMFKQKILKIEAGLWKYFWQKQKSIINKPQKVLLDIQRAGTPKNIGRTHRATVLNHAKIYLRIVSVKFIEFRIVELESRYNSNGVLSYQSLSKE